MTVIKIIEADGEVIADKTRISNEITLQQFLKIFKNNLNLIYGSDSMSKYGLKKPVSLFNEKFRMYCNYKHNKLINCIFELISGPAENYTNANPDYNTLQIEINYLLDLYKKNLNAEPSSLYEWRHSWRYPWGEITLMQQMQNSNVITDISWA